MREKIDIKQRKEAESIKKTGLNSWVFSCFCFIICKGVCVQKCLKRPSMLFTVCLFSFIPDFSGFVVLILMCLISGSTAFLYALKRNYMFFVSRNTKLEECGADIGQKTPTRQESLW